MEKTHKVPKIFISSTIKGKAPSDPCLEPYRQEICKMITSEFGWESICFEENDKYFSGSNISACLNAVQYADLYIGIFWKRHGSLITPFCLPLTELEFYRALNLKKPMRIYVIESTTREPYLQLFLDWVKGERFLCFCNLNELKGNIRNFLNHFGNIWFSKKLVSLLVPPSYIDEVLKKLYILPMELTIIPKETVCNIFDKEFIIVKLKKMKLLQSNYKYDEIIKEGWEILNMLSLKPPVKNKEFYELWIEFLQLWENACSWYGYIDGTFGSLWAAKSLMEMYRMTEIWPLFNSAASIVSSSTYALATLKQSKSQFIEDSKWQHELQKQSENLLHQALDYINFSFLRGGITSSGVWSIKGNIYRKLGDFDKAIKSHLMAIDKCISDEGYGIQISHLGRAKILKGDKKGLKNLEEGMTICNDLQSPSKVRTLKALGQGLIKLRKLDRAEEIIKKALHLAKKRGLGHQLESIKAALEIIKKRKRN